MIRRRFLGVAPPAPRGIGDDAAVLGRSTRTVISADCLIESIHFRRNEPPFLLGRKALAVNLSDIAAMGARPTSFLLVLGLPKDLDPSYLETLLDGMASAARAHDVAIVGGDISASPGPLMLSVTVLGALGRSGRPPLTRSGARVGHAIFVSGPLGDSAAGRWLLDQGWRPCLDRAGRRVTGVDAPRGKRTGAAFGRVPRTRLTEAIRRHLDPSPRLDLGARLRTGRIASASIDLSDGLSTDLHRLAEASGVGARLLEPAIPVGDPARAVAGALGIDPVRFGLAGGEEYELLFTVPPSRERQAVALGGLLIGRVTAPRHGLVLERPDGRRRRLERSGYEHLARTGPSRVPTRR